MRLICNTLALCLLFVLLPGASCGPPPDTPDDNGQRLHTQIALTIEKPLLAAYAILEARRDAEKAAVRRESSTPLELDERLTILERQYAPVDQAWALTQAAYVAYDTAIHTAGEDNTAIAAAFALALLSKWRSFLEAAEAMGLELPPIPDVLTKGVANGPA